MAFQGYLLKAGNTVFPHNYIQYEKFSTTPNIREEIEAYRDDYTRALYRVTAPGHVTTFKFTVKDGLHSADIKAIKDFFTSATVNSEQRKVQLTYWNMEDMTYKTSYFYRPDINYTIRQITGNDFICNEFDIEFIEYDPLNATVVS